MKEFNVNDYVWVRLTPLGYQIHREHQTSLVPHYPYTPPETDDEGWTRFQLWGLMQIFGPKISWGQLPFETTIRVQEV